MAARHFNEKDRTDYAEALERDEVALIDFPEPSAIAPDYGCRDEPHAEDEQSASWTEIGEDVEEYSRQRGATEEKRNPGDAQRFLARENHEPV
jgi:hypothetical protein